mmetsp:Transcript_2372/g.6885  ORF Transcript_2372/g.6885 Transcript_2372/m.6885 type:complete len:289 (+) Transcript_2372:254-1120(+)
MIEPTRPAGHRLHHRRRQPKLHLVATALASAVLVGCSVDAALFGNSHIFRWNASLNRITGEAAATETSMPRRRRKAASPKYAPNICDEKSLIKLLKSYPAWLSKPSVSFGVLRTSTLSERSDVARNRILVDRTQAQIGSPNGVSINDSLFGLNLLCFGKPRVSILKSSTSVSGRRRSLQADFPVIGGLLDGKRDATVSSSNNTNEHGCIRFVVEQEKIRDRDEKQRDRRCWRIVRIESCICDGYHPAIAGPGPVSPIRKAVYLSSQSLIHAYVMRRFHGMVLAECDTK